MNTKIAATLAAGIMFVHAGPAPGGGLDVKAVLGDTPILFTVRGPDRDGTHSYMRPGSFSRMGSALKVLDPDTGRTRVLVSSPQGIIRRPCVHFDGTRVLFSMCAERGGRFHIYEIEIDPTTLFTAQGEITPRQLTFAPDVYDVDPIYLPDGKIAFCSTRDHKIVPCAGQLVPQIFRMDADGANIHQITRSTVHENELSLMPDGRILYSRWDYVDRNFGDGHGFWASNPDGCNQSVVWGNNTAHPASPWTARAIPGTGKIICILGTHHNSLGGGMAVINPQIAVDGRKSIERTWPADLIKRFDAPRKLELPENKPPAAGTPRMTSMWPKEAISLLAVSHDYKLHGWNDDLGNVRPWYNTPFPLNDHQFLYVVSRDRKSPAAIYLGDIDGNEVMLHEESPGCYHPMPLAPSPRPGAIASPRDYQNGTGQFYIQNVYEGTHMEGVDPGSAKQVRVVQAHSKRGKSGHIWRALGHQEGQIGWSGFIAKTILGTAPVEEDGSAYFEVPADRFVYFQLLDKDGMMIQSMRSGTSVHSGERRGCIGCHESREAGSMSLASGRMTLALQREPSKLEPWLGEARRFNYLSEVQPVFDRHCLECHDFGGKGSGGIVLAGDKNFAFNISYCELQSKGLTGAIGAGPAGHLPALTWGSRTSPLIKLLKNGHPASSRDYAGTGPRAPREASGLGSGSSRQIRLQRRPTEARARVRLEKEEMDRLITWIDLNAPYYPTGYSARPGPLPGRNPLTRAQTTRFFQLTGLNDLVLGNASHYPGPQVSFDRPTMSPCLESITDKGERTEALSIIQEGRESLALLPRADMPGFAVLHPRDERARAHYDKYRDLERQVREAIRQGEKVYDSPEADPETSGL